MINYIGAYIVILLVIGIIVDRQKCLVVARGLDTIMILTVRSSPAIFQAHGTEMLLPGPLAVYGPVLRSSRSPILI